uniref:lysine-rich nucleolar protein 1-like isoform X2 n=1 Tax=Pristiophorus japonicus TaxID=55135 RepID=UPI00398F213D
MSGAREGLSLIFIPWSQQCTSTIPPPSTTTTTSTAGKKVCTHPSSTSRGKCTSFIGMFKNDMATSQSKSVKSKKQTEIKTAVNQNKEYGGKSKSKGEKKKKPKVKTILTEATKSDHSSGSDVCGDLKTFKKKKMRSRSSSIVEEKQDSEMAKKKNPPEGLIHEDTCGSLKKKKKKKKNKSKPDGHSGPQNISEGSKGKICENEASRVQDESKCNIKKKRKDNVKNADVEERLAPSNKTSNGTADHSDKMTEVSFVAEGKIPKKKKKRSHSQAINTHEDEKSVKKRKREKNTAEPESGNDTFNPADARKQKDDQILDTPSNKTDKKCTKKKKKEKLHTEEHVLEPDRDQKGTTISVENERKGGQQIKTDVECITKYKKKKKKRSNDAEGEGNEILDKERMKLDKAGHVCKFQHSSARVTAKGKKQEIALDVHEKSAEIKKKIKRKKKETSSRTRVCKIKQELCDNDDLQITSERKGNLFEVTIDKARRKALQEEIDRVSGKTGTLETKAPEIKPSAAANGLKDWPADRREGLSHQATAGERTGTQWDTATFESTEQKNKFLRLMGGLKSSNQPQSTGQCSGKPNMALNKQEEQKFNSTLQKEFDKALNLRQNRGIGLGYQPFPNHTQNKTFFIDKQASNSKKFDFN